MYFNKVHAYEIFLLKYIFKNTIFVHPLTGSLSVHLVIASSINIYTDIFTLLVPHKIIFSNVFIYFKRIPDFYRSENVLSAFALLRGSRRGEQSWVFLPWIRHRF